MLKREREREWDAESNEKLPSETATLVSEFTVEDLPLDRTAILVPAFAVKDLPLLLLLGFTTPFNILGHQRRFQHRAWKV